MKRIIVTLSILISITAIGQIQKGNLLLGGSIGLNAWQSSDALFKSKLNNIGLSSSLGLFINDRSVVGLQVGYTYLEKKYTYTSQSTKEPSHYFSIAPFYRYYFPCSEKVNFFIQGQARFLFGKSRVYSGYVDEDTGELIFSYFNSKYTSGALTINPGIVYFISNKWSIEAIISTLSYQVDQRKNVFGKIDSESLNFSFNSFNFGLTWYISK